MNFYPHHISDFNNSTRHLTRVERSVYRDAIELYYDTESVLTHDVCKLAKKLICRSEEEKQALNDILDEFFVKHDDGYFHSRCDHEISKYRANISAKAKAGIASAAARKQKAADRKQNSTRVKSSSTNQEPITINQEPITNLKEGGAKAPAPVKTTRFVKPTLSEAEEYRASKQLNMKCSDFIDHFDSNGWKVGGKAAMKDWRAAMRQWAKRDFGGNNKQSQGGINW
jgi:uncharacterized protein YdaU (DUF1376 family)